MIKKPSLGSVMSENTINVVLETIAFPTGTDLAKIQSISANNNLCRGFSSLIGCLSAAVFPTCSGECRGQIPSWGPAEGQGRTPPHPASVPPGYKAQKTPGQKPPQPAALTE